MIFKGNSCLSMVRVVYTVMEHKQWTNLEADADAARENNYKR